MATLNELEMLISSINRGIVSVEVGGHFGTSNLVGSERAGGFVSQTSFAD